MGKLSTHHHRSATILSLSVVFATQSIRIRKAPSIPPHHSAYVCIFTRAKDFYLAYMCVSSILTVCCHDLVHIYVRVNISDNVMFVFSNSPGAWMLLQFGQNECAMACVSKVVPSFFFYCCYRQCYRHHLHHRPH